MRKADAGFTLLELMITLVIGGILLTKGVPSLIKLVRDNRLVAQANDLVTAIGYARSEAIKRGGRNPTTGTIGSIVVCRTATSDSSAVSYSCGSGTGWESGWIIFFDNNSNGTYESANDQLLLSHGPLSGNNTLRGNNNVTNSFQFSSQGVVGTGGNGAFTLKDGRSVAKGGIRVICMAVTGRTRVFAGDRDNSQFDSASGGTCTTNCVTNCSTGTCNCPNGG